MTLGEKLKYARLELGWTQTKAAEVSGVCQPDISNYELGRRVPKLAVLIRLSEVYCRSLSFFLSKDKPEKATILWCGK